MLGVKILPFGIQGYVNHQYIDFLCEAHECGDALKNERLHLTVYKFSDGTHDDDTGINFIFSPIQGDPNVVINMSANGSISIHNNNTFLECGVRVGNDAYHYSSEKLRLLFQG